LLPTDSARARTEDEASRRLDPKRYAANVDSILNGIR
jgi:hypothetical protein